MSSDQQPTDLPPDLASLGKGVAERLSKVLPMERVTISPYEEIKKGKNNSIFYSAESEERIFDKMRHLLVSDPLNSGLMSRRAREASNEAKLLLGVDEARMAVDAHYRIYNSRILWGAGWDDGIIDSKFVGKLPKPLLIMCLQDHRFCISTAPALSACIKLLDIYDVIPKAVVAWKFKKQFPNVAKCKKVNMFPKSKPVVKCILFIARAWYCFQLLKETSLDESLRRKISNCLAIVEKEVIAKMKSQKDATATATTPTSTPQPHEKNPKASVSAQKANKKRPADDISTLDDTFPSSSKRSATGGLVHQLMMPLSTRKTSSGNIVSTTASSSSSSLENQRRKVSLLNNGNLTPQSSMAAENRFQLPDNLNYDNGEKDDGYWYPIDPDETILNPIEIEFAWLLEECLYCFRKWNTDFSFVLKYASPNLKIKLRELPPTEGMDGGSRQAEFIRNLVRLNEPSVEIRFFNFRREVRSKLLKGEGRARMETVLQNERKL